MLREPIKIAGSVLMFTACACGRPAPAHPEAAATSSARSATTTSGGSPEASASTGDDIADLLKDAVPEDALASAPPPYREWAMREITRRIERGARNLGVSPSAVELQQAQANVPTLVRKVVQASQQCNERECDANNIETPAILRRLSEAICPLFPFC